jgi:peptide/nickel transport system substrate-binding protein
MQRTRTVPGVTRTGLRCAGMLALAFAVACAPGADRPEGTVIVGMRTDFGGLNPITNSSLTTDHVMKFGLFTPLIQYDENLEPTPHLAESWEMHGDTAVTFTLRDDVRWHDGQPVTAEDVKFTFDMAKDPETASLLASAYLAPVASAQVVDARTITFRFEYPHAQALEDFWWPPVPRHLLEGVSATEMANAPFNRRPVGSGPFRFVEWRSNERIVLEANPDYPEGLGGPPAAGRVVFRVIPEAATRLTELLTGGIHIQLNVEPDQVQRVEQTGGVEVHSAPGTTLFYIGWNNARPPFDDARVRRAMTLAIDRQEIMDALLRGHARPATSTVPPWHPFAPRIDPLPYDPDQAARLLDEAGWQVRPDGTRQNAQGQPLRFRLLTSERALNRATVEVIQDQLRRVGATAQIEILEFQTMLAQHRNREFDAVLSNWVLDNFQMASAPRSLFHSEQADIEGSANRSGVRIPRLDRLIDAGAIATDDGRAREIWRELTEVLQEEQPFTFMFWMDDIAGARDVVSGFDTDERSEFVSMREWSVR